MTREEALFELNDIANLITDAETIINSVVNAADDEGNAGLRRRAAQLESRLQEAREDTDEIRTFLE